jgi:mRNA interferase RelE/StbE
MSERWTVALGGHEKRYLVSLPRKECARILDALALLEEDPFGGDVIELKGREGWRLRVGRWRVLFRLDADKRTIVVLGIGPRGDVYK